LVIVVYFLGPLCVPANGTYQQLREHIVGVYEKQMTYTYKSVDFSIGRKPGSGNAVEQFVVLAVESSDAEAKSDEWLDADDQHHQLSLPTRSKTPFTLLRIQTPVINARLD